MQKGHSNMTEGVGPLFSRLMYDSFSHMCLSDRVALGGGGFSVEECSVIVWHCH